MLYAGASVSAFFAVARRILLATGIFAVAGCTGGENSWICENAGQLGPHGAIFAIPACFGAIAADRLADAASEVGDEHANAREGILLRDAAASGDRVAAYEYGQRLSSEGDREAVDWMCRAASAGNTDAQILLAMWHRPDLRLYYDADGTWLAPHVPVDALAADIWYALAIANGRSDAEAPRQYFRRITPSLDPSSVPARVAQWENHLCPKPYAN